MTNQESIQAIERSEKDAETAIARAREHAQQKRNELEVDSQERIARLKDTLSAEMSVIAEKVQREGISFKEEQLQTVTDRLHKLRSMAQQRISTAADFVFGEFTKYVSKQD